MSERQFFSKEITNWFRGISVLMVLISHYAEWWTWFTPVQGNLELFCRGLTKLGVYGVDIFFLFSGYAMVKSLNGQKMNKSFIRKRIRNVYIPYLVIVGIIELLSGGFGTVRNFWRFLSGYNYWFMLVLFLFYIGFIVIWAIARRKEMRVVLLGIYAGVFSYILYKQEMAEFWYVSNIAFVIGVVVGEYEPQAKLFLDKAGKVLSIVLSALMIWVVYSGIVNLKGGVVEADTAEVWYKIGASVVWILVVMFLSSRFHGRDGIMTLIGKSSIYMYLTHTYIFMSVVNFLTCNIVWRFVISMGITFAVSVIFYRFMICLRRQKSV